MVVVWVAVARVHGHVEEIFALDQIEPVDLHGDHTLAVDLPEREALHRGVGPVAADPVLAEDADAEHGVLDRAMRAEAEMDGAGLARLEEVPLASVAARELDAGQLDLPAPPARRRARPGDRLGPVVLDPERPGFLARHVVEVAPHDLPRFAMELEPPLVEPHGFVAEALDAAEVVGDEHDGLARAP